MPIGDPVDVSHLENSMIRDITIPMSLNDFARRERFKVGFGLMVSTISRINECVTDKSWDDINEEEARGIQLQLIAYLNTLNTIVQKIKEDEE